MNNWNGIGRLTRDPEKVQSEKANMAKFSLAVNDGKDKVLFVDVLCFDKTAENVVKYMSKGRLVGVEGSLSCRKWEDKEGNKRQSWGIRAFRVHFLDSGNKKDGINQEEQW